MELGKFKRVDFDEDDVMPEWLRDEQPVAKKPQALKKPSQVKLTEEFGPSQVKSGFHSKVDKPQEPTPEPAISIQIHMPTFKMPSIPFARLRPWAIVLAIVLLAVFGGKALLGTTEKKASVQKAPTVVQAELGYKPLRSVQQDAGKATATQPTFNDKKQLYTFNDTYMGASLTVDQQALPDKLKTSKTAISDLARSIGAYDSFTTTRGTVYISSSENANTQRMMVISDKMLMFIQSTKVLPNADWVNYIQRLES